jgi:hypothetical protein
MPWLNLKGNAKKHPTVLKRHKKEIARQFPNVDWSRVIVHTHPDSQWTGYWIPLIDQAELQQEENDNAKPK